ncbi:LZTFL1 [Blepharisma stoltei]|uniref:Leucine zipper transcription factor-like protein 1 n=1 Tax=Blepharisma stoltei TaxID=1481888 RepID=A0AAU9K9G0_9CILI|nr:unnamed protein product [Blepharisma stoltei]
MEGILSPDHQVEVKKYLDFFALKRRENLKEIDTSAKQFIAKNLNEDALLQKNEVEAFMDNFVREVSSTIEAELQNIAHMSGVYIKILMNQAQTHNLTLQADTSFIENLHAIEEMRNIERSQKALDLNKRTQGARLPTLQTSFNNDPLLVKQLNELKEENNTLKNRMKQMQTQISQILDEKMELRNAVESLTAQLENGPRHEEPQHDTQAIHMLEETKLQLQTKEELIKQLKEEQDKRLADSKQFQSLKKLIVGKNEQIKELREQLERLQKS